MRTTIDTSCDIYNYVKVSSSFVIDKTPTENISSVI